MPYATRRVMIDGTTFYLARASQNDITALLDIERAVYAGQTPWNRWAFTNELSKQKTSLYLVLCQGTEVVAFVGAWFTANEAHITNIAVHPSYQKRGIGHFLVHEMVNIAHDYPSQKITLEVRASNTTAQAVYRKLGFTIVRTRPNYYIQEKEDAFSMRRVLNQ
ncbi:ribosomal protein S18-alanine N-acetyltransferase [Latilactobacillus graminis]|uniref:Ribosomal-protein-alanine N-acetyltransferase n=1 Tax=Latilactobacillus graminis TaxID=60519 RepID=A0ABX6C607_9LACO|nr:ribosomal protein S18-alanine N-acetyltransferase [Latilactobacillus graminis]QFP79016.1 ribosomal-protein-alanine N-acetyltransferase [Latilactobacillus graminis]